MPSLVSSGKRSPDKDASTLKPAAAKKAKQCTEELLSCPYKDCQKAYTRACRVEEHIRSHTGERPFKCDAADCGKSFLRESHLKEHTLSHQGQQDRPYKCSFEGCTLSFTGPRKLRTHEKIHCKPLPYECTDFPPCAAAFHKQNQLRKHISSEHTYTKPFPCDQECCTQSFETQAKLRSHKDRVHSSIPRYFCAVQNCPSLSTGFTKWTDLQKHVKFDHIPQCTVCGKVLSNIRQLQSHVMVHRASLEERRIHTCDVEGCDLRFTKPSALKTHVSVLHENNRPFSCPYSECGEWFGYKKIQQQHIKNVHEEPKPKRCRKVGSHVRLSKALSGHSDERSSYPCIYVNCDYSCAHQDHLERHISNCHH